MPTNLNTSFGPSNMVPLNEMEGKEKKLGEGENQQIQRAQGQGLSFFGWKNDYQGL